MRGSATAAPVSAPRSASGPVHPGKSSGPESGSPFDAELSAALSPTRTAIPQSEEAKPAPVERERQEAPEEEDGEDAPPTAAIFPFPPTPPPIPLLTGELALVTGTPAGEPGDALSTGGEQSAPGGATDLTGALGSPLADADGVAALEQTAGQAELPDTASTDGEGAGLDVLLAEFAPGLDDASLSDPVRARTVPSALPPAAASDEANPPEIVAAATPDAPQATGERVENPDAKPEGATPPRETAVEKSPAPDEGVSEGLRVISPPRHDPAPAASPQGESQPVSAAVRRELPAQVARLSASMVRELAGDGVKEIRVRLDPPSLGEIQVRVESERGELRIHVVAASPETAALLSDGQSHLREELARQGMALANFSAGTESAFSFASEGGFTPRERDGGRGPGLFAERSEEPIPVSAPVRRVGSGRLDARA